MDKFQVIRPVVLGIAKRDNKILVSEGYDKVKNQTFYRCLGGGIEFFETSQEALVREFKEELDIPDYENDYLKIAQLYKNQRKHKEYKERLEEILDAQNNRFNCIHEELLSLKPCHIVTTNYDVLLESAIAKKNERYYTVSRDEDLPYNRGERLLIKMHGDFKADNIVLTENDYLDYSRNFPLIRAYIMSLFASKLVLFIGFSFNDINLKYILRDVRSCLGDKMQPVYLLSNSEMKEYALDYFDSNLSNYFVQDELEGAYSKTRYEIKNNGKENILYLYLNMAYEFSRELVLDVNHDEITRRTKNFIKNNSWY